MFFFPSTRFDLLKYFVESVFGLWSACWWPLGLNDDKMFFFNPCERSISIHIHFYTSLSVEMSQKCKVIDFTLIYQNMMKKSETCSEAQSDVDLVRWRMLILYELQRRDLAPHPKGQPEDVALLVYRELAAVTFSNQPPCQDALRERSVAPQHTGASLPPTALMHQCLEVVLFFSLGPVRGAILTNTNVRFVTLRWRCGVEHLRAFIQVLCGFGLVLFLVRDATSRFVHGYFGGIIEHTCNG